ncbi:hypothetical protein J2X66_006006 [Pseudomonas sp. 3296]|uniref:SMI1/KNR4 family protein n=1 Tax=Pseudomonas sp. 3296 TaxID=2817753 RepID=UPI002860E231|nr:SMI1/KNR4 family protein [Pseudomonas sp. 3296]MDR6919100.1 hypothetical protein [Pseudomonas sp. 3296]
MTELSKIEQQYRFTLPRTYRSFVEHGYFAHPSETFLWVHEAEWLPPSEMLQDGGFWGNPKPGLVAFAFSGRRDLWAWQTQCISNLSEPTIVFCPRDDWEGEWFAPSFLGWLYRVCLEYGSSLWYDEPKTRMDLSRWAAVLQEHGAQEWANVVRSVACRKIVAVESGAHGYVERSLINKSEVDDRITAAFGPHFIGGSYIWDWHGEPPAG